MSIVESYRGIGAYMHAVEMRYPCPEIRALYYEAASTMAGYRSGLDTFREDRERAERILASLAPLPDVTQYLPSRSQEL